MALQIRERDEKGNLLPPTKVFSGLTTDETVAALGMQLTQEKLNGMQKDAIINALGTEVASLKLQIYLMKGGEE